MSILLRSRFICRLIAFKLFELGTPYSLLNIEVLRRVKKLRPVLFFCPLFIECDVDYNSDSYL
jgi:hypothetical protein